MPTPDLGPEAQKLIDRMVGPPPSHARFTGEPIDLTQIDALALGDLWVVAHATRRRDRGRLVESLATTTAWAILEHAAKTDPAFRGTTCRDYLDLLAREIEAEPDTAVGIVAIYPWKRACFVLEHCIDLTFGGLGPAAQRFLAAATDWRVMPHLAVGLARLVDTAFETRALTRLAADLAGSPLLVDELGVVAGLPLRQIIEIVALLYPDFQAGPSIATRHHPLSDYPAYAAFAKAGLEQAVVRLRAIHNRTVPYASDKAFTLDESAVIGRLTRVALDRDEAWTPPVLDELFRKTSLAPTAAKSVPSQSVSIGLGHAIEAFPTPEAIATLRGVLRDIRHAGVKLKLQRNLRGAERGLSGRMAIALRLPRNQLASKAHLATLTRSLEASLALGLELDHDDWCTRLVEHPQVRPVTASLLWRVLDAHGSTAVLPICAGDGIRLENVLGAAVTPLPRSRMALWHPVDAAAADREAWRERLTRMRIKQPFKQVFREHYSVAPDALAKSTTAMFAGHIVSIVPFLGLARRERWHVEYDGLTRSFGRWMARVTLADHVYPGCVGATTTGHLALLTSDGKTTGPAPLGDLPSATLSEILRAVDLLVSTSGFAVAATDPRRHREARLQHLAQGPLGAMAEMRKQALTCALRGIDGMDDLHFDATHLRLGAYAIHLATGRITCDGEPVSGAPAPRSNLVAVPWLPYDEKLLELIASAALAVAQDLRR